MFEYEPVLSKNPVVVKFLSLILIIFFSTFLTFFVGILMAIPFYGTDVLDILTNGTDLEGEGEINLLKFLQLVSQIGVFILPSLVFAWLSYGNIEKSLTLDKFPSYRTFIMTGLLVFAMLPGIHLLIQFNEGLQLPEFLQGVETWMKEKENKALRLTEEFLNTTSIGGLVINLLMIGILAAIGEELLFRAVLIRLLQEWIKNKHLAVILSAILFSAFHLQFFGFIPRFVLGLMFGYLFIWSGSVWLPIAAHFVNNASAVIVTFFAKKGVIYTNAEDFGTIDSLPLLIASVVLTVALISGIFLREKQILSHNQQ